MGLKIHYTMNVLNGEGKLPDVSGNGYDGTPTNVSWVAGKINQAASFDGTAQIDVSSPGNVLDGKLLTISGWINTANDAAAGYQYLVDRVYNGQFAAYLTTDGQLRVGIKGVGGASYGSISNAYVPDNTTTHVAYVYDGSYVHGYINGVLKGSLSMPYGVLATSASNIRIGRRLDAGFPFEGLIDDLRIYDEALPAWYIKKIVNHMHGTEHYDPARQYRGGTFERIRRAA